MKQINIIKSGIVTNSAKFETEVELQNWLAEEITNGSFGKPEHQELSVEATYDEQGVELTPAEYVTIPSKFAVEIVDITLELAAESQKLARIAAGKAAADTCQTVLYLIGGFNIERSLTFQQKNDMKTIFAEAKSALNDFQPSYAKYFINLIEADGVLVTAEMKSQCLALLAAY